MDISDNSLKEVLAKINEITEFLGVNLTNVNQRGIFGNTPLKVAIVWGDKDAVKILLKAGADVNAKLEDGYTPLHHAVAQGDLDMVRILVVNGARINEQNTDGDTPMDIALLQRNNEITELLRQYEAKDRKH